MFSRENSKKGPAHKVRPRPSSRILVQTRQGPTVGLVRKPVRKRTSPETGPETGPDNLTGPETRNYQPSFQPSYQPSKFGFQPSGSP